MTRAAAICSVLALIVTWIGAASFDTAGRSVGSVLEAPIEPEALYTPEAFTALEREVVRFAYRSRARGDIVAAIEQMQMVANALVRRLNDDFELWDNLAELYCAQAARERNASRARDFRANGLALIQEFKCATAFYATAGQGMACRLPGNLVPNPAFTPLCYQLFCTEGRRDAIMQGGGEGEEQTMYEMRVFHSSSYHEDAANISQVEKSCR